MANNLRVSSINATSSVLLKAFFTDVLSPNISVDNVSIISQTTGVPDPQVLKVRVIGNSLEITTQPLTNLAAYVAVFISTNTVIFQSLNTTSVLFQDGVANKIFFLGPIESTNVVKEYFLNYLQDNVYNTEDGTVLGNYLNILSIVLSKVLYDIRQSGNENYLSLTVTDERKIRGETAFDHLEEEGAYEILRVGRTVTGAIASLTLSVDEFTTDPVSLLRGDFSENLTINSIDKNGIFNINTFILNLSKRFVIILKSVTFTYTNGHLPYIYNIDTFGYQILDSKYDTNVAFAFAILADNQIKLSDKILEDPNFSLDDIFQVQVSYQYKDTGRVLDPTTIVIDEVLSSGREVLPPLFNVFNLAHGPVVTSNNNIGSIGNVTFVDQNSLAILQVKHPAFTAELKFRLDFLPANPGEYSVDYDTGTVYVYGSDNNATGTGATPPLAIYLYRQTFKENIDWIIDSDTNDLVALTTGNLINNTADITFNYEQVLAEDIDYKAPLHQEVLDERIGNNLVALNALATVNTPITDVFRIFNETSGEIYSIARWNDSKVFFSYNTPPKIETILGERASFQIVNNEVMFVSNVINTNSPLVQIFKIILNNNNIMALSEDCIGASFNSTISLSDKTIFVSELYVDTQQTETLNLARLNTVGNYFVDYINGIIYVTVSASQDFNIGTVSYKRGYIVPQNPYITSIEDIFYRINTLSSKEKHFDYIQFGDGFILPSSFDVADEQLLSNNLGSPYLILSGQVGAFVDAIFVPTVTNAIQFIRSIYENNDLLNNTAPINFASAATFNFKSITVAPLKFQEYHTIEFDGTNYFVILNTGLQYLSPNITLNISVVRLSDSQNLWNGAGTVVLGNLIKLILPGVGSPHSGDSVLVSYTYTILDLSHLIVDYNKGEYYIDYDALTDEIIVSYEYGDNVLDFRESSALNAGDTYFATYKVGALRDALLKNFGSLIDISLLNNFDITFSRERYRDALIAAMHSFSLGPTPTAIKNIATTISHIPAVIDESIFENWSLGNSLLSPRPFETNGDITLVSAKYDDGLLINEIDQQVRLPVISNLKLSEGTFEAWIGPNWDGLDNFAELYITPFEDGYLDSELDVFIGALEYHPTYQTDDNGKKFFTVDKFSQVEGIPNKNKNGIYVYYDKDISGAFNRWFIDVIDGYINDGYLNDGYDGYTHDGYDEYTNKIYSIGITTNGRFYDVKSTLNPKPSSSTIASGTNSLNFTIRSTSPNEGITFVADIQHYILDFAQEENKNRFSILKDETGYLKFIVYDKLRNSYTVSANVSNWRHGDLHHIATSWKINNKMGRDELHLFIDGFEVPNIIKYGDRIKPYLHENFRTVNPEEIVGVVNRNIIAGNDLSTVIGSNQVVSSINFSQYGINITDIIYIEEAGFNIAGYTITNVNGNTLTLSSLMPFTITAGTFSVNKVSFNVSTEIDIFPNFAVSLLHSYIDGYDLSTTDGYNIVTSVATNFIAAGVVVGDLIRINDPNFDNHYVILSVSAHTLIINDNMPITLSGLSFNIYHNIEQEIPGLRAIHPAYTLADSTDGYFTNILTLRDKALIDDLVLIRTFGINHRRIRRRYYVWSDQSNILKTKLPTPLSLDEVNFYRILLAHTFVGPSNATLIGGIFHSNNIPTDQPSNNAGGRTLAVSIHGDNIDFSTPTTVSINGTSVTTDGYGDLVPTVETLTFIEPGIQFTTHLFALVDHINVNCKPINSSRNCAVVEIKEKYSITQPENLDLDTITSPDTVPQAVVRYSYQVSVGNTLQSDGYQGNDGYMVTDAYNFFSDSVVNNYLIITNPISVAGFYQIGGVSIDHHSLTLNIPDEVGELPFTAFNDGYYQILNVTDFRSGLQNGYFTFEHKPLPGIPYRLRKGWYELDYYTYLSIPFDLQTSDMYIGSDFRGANQLQGSIDELQILNTKLTDTRVGETSATTQRTITKEFNLVKASKADITTLVLAHFDTLPPINEADIYRFADSNIIQAGEVINDNFVQSIALINNPLIIDNNGILNTKTEGTIEFWINPLFDANNDPNYRFYFDAFGAVTENLISINSTTIQLIGVASQILSVKLQVNNLDVDFFAGGQLTNSGKTLLLHKSLPNQNTNVSVTYLPNGLVGDRISIYKDPSGYINFNIQANNIDYQVRAPVFWARNTWHRVKASYSINGGMMQDQLHLFLDGYERGDILYGSNLLFGQGMIWGSSFSGPNQSRYNIRFQDNINQFSIGADFNNGNSAYCLIDNFRISDIMRPIYQPFGEPLDPNYSSNLHMVFPITKDLNTTLLLDFDTLVTKNTDFTILNDRNTGLSNFGVTVFDSLDIIDNNTTVKQVLEALLKSFKPANSQIYIKYD